VDRRLLRPIGPELLNVKKRQLVDVAVAVSAGGGEEAVDGAEVVLVPVEPGLIIW